MKIYLVPLYRKNIFTAKHGTISILPKLFDHDGGRPGEATAGDGASDGSR
jgi:hypothetical protein